MCFKRTIYSNILFIHVHIKKSNDYLTGNLLQHIETQVDECKKIENKKQKIARNKECENQNQ